jgi:hypothetical protein
MIKLRTMIAMSTLAGVVATGSVLTSSEAAASDKRLREESAEQAQKRTSKQREVSGTVLDMKKVKFKGTDQANVVALLQTNKNHRRLAVDLGPEAQLKKMNLKKGQQLAASGVVLNVGDRPVFVADQVKRGDKSIAIDRLAQMKALKASSSKSAKSSSKQD